MIFRRWWWSVSNTHTHTHKQCLVIRNEVHALFLLKHTLAHTHSLIHSQLNKDTRMRSLQWKAEINIFNEAHGLTACERCKQNSSSKVRLFALISLFPSCECECNAYAPSVARDECAGQSECFSLFPSLHPRYIHSRFVYKCRSHLACPVLLYISRINSRAENLLGNQQKKKSRIEFENKFFFFAVVLLFFFFYIISKFFSRHFINSRNFHSLTWLLLTV